MAAINRRKIWIVDSDGSNRHQLVKDSTFREERPQWSSDGTFILFFRLNGKFHVSLWKSNRDGSIVVPVIEKLYDNSSDVGYYGYSNWGACLTWWKGHKK